MTSDNLLKFLGNREYLHQVSYQELKSMVVEYPYSLSLRYLLAMKSQQEDNTDLDRNIELLSTYGIDRSHLHRIFSEDPIVLEDLEESIIMGEDFLELKELSSLERDLKEGLVVNEVNNLNFLQEKEAPIAQEIPIPTPGIALPPPPPIPEPEEAIALAPIIPSLEEITPVLVGAALIADNGTVEPEEKETLELIENTLEEEVTTPVVTVLEEGSTEISPITADIPIPIEKEDSLPTEETVESIEEVEEEFITLDFEDEILAEASGIATIGHEEAPSASFATNEVVETEGGLPSDAIEVNDLYANPGKSVLDDALVEALFEEAEAEAVAEPAASDSTNFIENPEAILVTESEAIEEATTPLEERGNLIELEQEIEIEQATENIVLAEVSQKVAIPSVAFEIEYSETDPITFESIQAGTDVIPLEELEIVKEDTILADEQEVAIPITAEDIGISQTEVLKEIVKEKIPQLETPLAEIEESVPEVAVSKIKTIEKEPIPQPLKATFKFNSLDQLEATFNQSTKATKPAPKVKFDSWQEQYAGVGQFSGINLIPLINGTGKIIKRKRKVIHKEFEKTVAFAEESLALDSALASETLAQLLVKQGQYSKARTMYEQLCLLMPKKSSFFAGEIEKIQNLPDEDS